MTSIDEWDEKLRCPSCGKTGMVSLSQANGDNMPTVLSITDGFKPVQTEYGPDFRCGTCDIAVDPQAPCRVLGYFDPQWPGLILALPSLPQEPNSFEFVGRLQVARLALPPEKAAGMFAPRKWTYEDDERLQELTAAGKQPIAISKELRRSEPAIIQRAAILKNRAK